jgi:cation diffusion facilitator family transporter
MVNLLVALTLLRAAKRYQSITLKANAYHLMTDVWTSAGVLVGVTMVALTDWHRLDPIVALFVACNIVRSGVHIVRDSILGLMDTALPAEEQDAVHKALEPHKQGGVKYHALLTRRAGTRRFVSLHVLVPGTWTVQRGHRLLERIEADIRDALPEVTVFTHLESLSDPASWDDVGLDRGVTTPPDTPAKHPQHPTDNNKAGE